MTGFVSPPSAPSAEAADDVGWIGHAGLAGTRPGAFPSRQGLADAARLGLDWLELDICVTSDGALVLRHHTRLPGGRPLHQVPFAVLRSMEPAVLTLDDAVEEVADRVPLLLDVKSRHVVAPLAEWLGRREAADAIAVCSDNRETMLEVRDRAPRAPRWWSMTAPFGWAPRAALGWLRPLLADSSPGAEWLTDGLGALSSNLAQSWLVLLGGETAAERVRRAAATMQRDRLPRHAVDVASEIGATTVSVDYWAITPALCDEAHRAGLSVAAWTVNRIEVACELVHCGVDFITTDEIGPMRRAVSALRREELSPGHAPAGIHRRGNGPTVGSRRP